MKISIILWSTVFCLNAAVSCASNVKSSRVIIGKDEPVYYKLPSEAELTPAEFQRMQKILLKAVRRYNERVKHTPDFSVEPLSNYGVQYKVALNKKGEKEVWINGFCKESGFQFKNLESEPVIVFDGGSCFFNLTINIESSKTTPVIIHGFA